MVSACSGISHAKLEHMWVAENEGLALLVDSCTKCGYLGWFANIRVFFHVTGTSKESSDCADTLCTGNLGGSIATGHRGMAKCIVTFLY